MVQIKPTEITQESYTENGITIKYNMNTNYMGKSFITINGNRITPNSFKSKKETMQSLKEFIKRSGGITRIKNLQDGK